jgi:hypothetical protein
MYSLRDNLKSLMEQENLLKRLSTSIEGFKRTSLRSVRLILSQVLMHSVQFQILSQMSLSVQTVLQLRRYTKDQVPIFSYQMKYLLKMNVFFSFLALMIKLKSALSRFFRSSSKSKLCKRNNKKAKNRC